MPGGSREYARHLISVRVVGSRVDVAVEGGDVLFYARTACDAPESEPACEPFDDRLTLADQPAGAVYVVIDPASGGSREYASREYARHLISSLRPASDRPRAASTLVVSAEPT